MFALFDNDSSCTAQSSVSETFHFTKSILRGSWQGNSFCFCFIHRLANKVLRGTQPASCLDHSSGRLQWRSWFSSLPSNDPWIFRIVDFCIIWKCWPFKVWNGLIFSSVLGCEAASLVYDVSKPVQNVHRIHFFRTVLTMQWTVTSFRLLARLSDSVELKVTRC